MATIGVTTSLLCSLAIFTVQGASQPPTIGDIRLQPCTGDNLQGFYEPLIYYTDGTSRPQYGAVCSNSSGEAEGKVLCRQLGYTFDETKYRPTGSPVWFKNILCDDSSATHILRCQTTPASGDERNSPTVCGASKKRLLIKCNFEEPLTPYDGQVALCPSDDAQNSDDGSNITTSTSFGVVSIYYKNHDVWRGLNQRNGQPALEGNNADAICRQMGFTEAYPGSAATINASDYTFNNCFSNTSSESPFILQEGAWITMDSVKNNGPQRCFGCCYNYPQSEICQECDTAHNIVIRCAFDPSKTKTSDGTAGSQRDCELNSRKQITQCESAGTPPPTQNTQSLHNTIHSLRIALGFTIVLLLILGPFGLCYLVCLYKKNLHSRVVERVSPGSEKSRGCCQFDTLYDDENTHLSEPT